MLVGPNTFPGVFFIRKVGENFKEMFYVTKGTQEQCKRKFMMEEDLP